MKKTKKTKILIILCVMLLLLISLNFKWVYGLLLILFIPGFALSLVLFRDMQVDERIGSAVILSISLNILTIFSANYFLGLEITGLNIAALMLLISLLFVLLYLIVLYFRIQELLKIKDSIKNFKLKRNDALKSLLLVSTLLIVFNLVYAVHWDYPYPYHLDEWQNLAASAAITDNRGLLNEAPNSKGVIERKVDLEVGSHIFLAELFLLTGADPVMSYKYLPALFAAISAFMLFLVIKRHSFYAAILSMLFFASLKTNISILGIWIFAPVTMSIAMIYGIAYMFLKAIENKLSFFFSASVSLLALALIHPISAVFVYMFVLLYIVLKFVYYLLYVIKKILLGADEIDTIFTKENITGFGMLFLIPFISFIYFFAILSKGSLSSTINWFITKFIIFPKVTSISSLIYQPNYIPDIYGLLGIGLAVIGILYIFYMTHQWKHLNLLVVAALTGIINLTLFHFPQAGAFLLNGAAFIFLIFGINLVFNLPEYFALFMFYERLIYYTLIFMAPLSAIGLYAVASRIANLGTLNRIHRYLGILLCFILTIAVLAAVFGNYYGNYYGGKGGLYKMVTDEDYEAIKWIGENKGRGHVILARPEVSITIYPISRNYAAAESYRFLIGDCSERLKILKTQKVDYVISDFEMCNWKEIHRNEKDYVYEVKAL